jgi:hypothetical protein
VILCDLCGLCGQFSCFFCVFSTEGIIKVKKLKIKGESVKMWNKTPRHVVGLNNVEDVYYVTFLFFFALQGGGHWPEKVEQLTGEQ